MTQLTKYESLLLLACKGWDLTEFLTEPVNTSPLSGIDRPFPSCYKPLQVMVFDYPQLTEYYHIRYCYLVDVDLYTVITRDLLKLVTKLRPMYVNECVINSIDLSKQRILPEHNHLFQLLRNQIVQVSSEDYRLCNEQLPTKYINKYNKGI